MTERPDCLDGYTIEEFNTRARIQSLRLDMLYHMYLTSIGKCYLTDTEYTVESQELLKLQVAQKHLTDGIVYPEFMNWDGKTFDEAANEPDNVRTAEFMYAKRFPVKKSESFRTLFSQPTKVAPKVPQRKQVGIKKLF